MIATAAAFCMYVVALAMAMSLWRLLRGPTLPDRILALDTVSINSIALLVLYGIRVGSMVYFEAALVIAMLGFVSTVALSKYVMRRDIVE